MNGTRKPRTTTEERFWARVDKSGTCWKWQGSSSQGYGSFSADGRTVRAHRYAYELTVGPIPHGLVLDHLCRVRSCVNPAHLEPVTNVENVLRGAGWAGTNSRKTHCVHGHEYTPENTVPIADGRRCRTCIMAWRKGRTEAKQAITTLCGARGKRGPCGNPITDLSPCHHHGTTSEKRSTNAE